MRKIDIVRIRKEYLPKGSDKAVKDFAAAIKGQNKEIEIDDSKESLILWETVKE